MTDSDPRQNAKIDNRKASNAQDLETQMTAVGRAAHLSLSTQLFVQKLVHIYGHDCCRLIECMFEGGGEHAMI